MSGIVAKYGARYFSSMGKFCLYIDEPHYPTESRFVENSLVIVFSVSGESRDTIGHVMRFKEQNCQILSVTHCMTRLRFVVKDEGKINDAAVKATDGTEGMSTLTKDKQSLEAMYRKGWQDAEKLVQWYRAAKAEA